MNSTCKSFPFVRWPTFLLLRHLCHSLSCVGLYFLQLRHLCHSLSCVGPHFCSYATRVISHIVFIDRNLIPKTSSYSNSSIGYPFRIGCHLNGISKSLARDMLVKMLSQKFQFTRISMTILNESIVNLRRCAHREIFSKSY